MSREVLIVLAWVATAAALVLAVLVVVTIKRAQNEEARWRQACCPEVMTEEP